MCNKHFERHISEMYIITWQIHSCLLIKLCNYSLGFTIHNTETSHTCICNIFTESDVLVDQEFFSLADYKLSWCCKEHHYTFYTNMSLKAQTLVNLQNLNLQNLKKIVRFFKLHGFPFYQAGWINWSSKSCLRIQMFNFILCRN